MARENHKTNNLTPDRRSYKTEQARENKTHDRMVLRKNQINVNCVSDSGYQKYII